MSTIATEPVVSEGAAPRRSTGERRPRVLVALAVLIVGLGVWWWATAPRLEGGGVAGVSSADHDVVWASGLREDVFVVPADGPGSSTIVLGLRNDGRLPVELVDVWPSRDEPRCSWRPSERWLTDDHGPLGGRARAVSGAVLEPGAHASVYVTGAVRDPAGCAHAALTSVDDVEVVARVGGRTSTSRVPLGYSFGYADDPDVVRSFYEVRVLPPSEPPAGP